MFNNANQLTFISVTILHQNVILHGQYTGIPNHLKLVLFCIVFNTILNLLPSFPPNNIKIRSTCIQLKAVIF